MAVYQNHTLRIVCPDGINRATAINHATAALPAGWTVEIVGPVPAQVGGQQTPAHYWTNWPDRGIN